MFFNLISGSQKPTEIPTTQRTTTLSWWNRPSSTQNWWDTTYSTQNNWETTKSTQNWWSTTTKPVTSTKPSLQGISEISCINGQYYPHESCGNFYICDNNQLIVQSCAPGLNWNIDSQICDWPFKVRCTTRRKLAQTYADQKNFIYSK